MKIVEMKIYKGGIVEKLNLDSRNIVVFSQIIL